MNPRRSLSDTGSLERRAHSYLVRVWVEPREMEGESARVRGYVRDLRTGEETYLNDPDELGPYLDRQLGMRQRTEGRLSRFPIPGGMR